jgi:hypothetical protein
MQERLDSFRITEADWASLEMLCDDVHHMQNTIEYVVREYSECKPVPALRQSLFQFVQRLDQALLVESKARARTGKNQDQDASRTKLPVAKLDLGRIEKLCLFLSSLASNHSTPVLTANQRVTAGDLMASITAKLMKRVLACGGVKAMDTSQMLDIHNWNSSISITPICKTCALSASRYSCRFTIGPASTVRWTRRMTWANPPRKSKCCLTSSWVVSPTPCWPMW